MKHPLTEEQKIAIGLSQTGEDLKIVAFAGAGKTATLVALAEAMPFQRVLYLAFNKVIAEEAKAKMPRNATARTFHSLALSQVGPRLRQRLFNPSHMLDLRSNIERVGLKGFLPQELRVPEERVETIKKALVPEQAREQILGVYQDSLKKNACTKQWEELMEMTSEEQWQTLQEDKDFEQELFALKTSLRLSGLKRFEIDTLEGEEWVFRSREINAYDALKLAKQTFDVFCRSADTEISEKHVELSFAKWLGKNVKDLKLGKKLKKQILDVAQFLWEDANNQGSPFPVHSVHDFYLKLWQMTSPQIDADVILFDEAQDADGLMLDILSKQRQAQVIYVGDPHQQIYEWRGAKNALQNLQENTCYLTTSFRFGPNIAEQAGVVLKFLGEKNTIKGFSPQDSVEVCNIFTEEEDRLAQFMVEEDIEDLHEALSLTAKNSLLNQVDAILTRTNLGALQAAIDLVEMGKPFKLEMEIGDLKTRLQKTQEVLDKGYATPERQALVEGWWDLVTSGKKVKAPVLEPAESIAVHDEVFLDKGIHDKADLLLYTANNMLCSQVSRYAIWLRKYELPFLLKVLEQSQNRSRNPNAITISTIHKAKGMEWNTVYLSAELAERLLNEGEDGPTISKQEEEIRLFYVALTRAKNRLIMPRSVNKVLRTMEQQK